MEETRGVIFYAVCALWAVATIAVLIAATRICYAIEARSGRRPLKHGLPGYANLIPVALNFGVAGDAETQAMRWRMNRLLLALLGGLALFYIYVMRSGVTD